jgi:rhamnosyltransferase
VSKVTLQGEIPSPKQLPTPNGSGQQKAAQFWVVVPTLNPGLKAWADWIAALKAQNSQPQKVVIVDSGSEDGSLALTQSEGFSLFHVKAQNFDHGGTRQWALARALQAAQTEGFSPPDVVVFITQDALLAHPSALQNLLQAFDNPQIGAAYGRQLAKPQAAWLECHARAFNYPEAAQTLSLSDRLHLGFKTCFFSNAFGAYRLPLLLAHGGLPAGLPLGEDTFMAAKLLLSGQSLQYQASAVVYHSHNYSRLEDFQRMFDTGVFHAQNNWLIQSFGKPEGEGIRLLKSQWAFLKVRPQSPNKLIGLLQIVLTNGVKLCGYKMGTWHRLLPQALKQGLAMNKSFWHQRK